MLSLAMCPEEGQVQVPHLHRNMPPKYTANHSEKYWHSALTIFKAPPQCRRVSQRAAKGGTRKGVGQFFLSVYHFVTFLTFLVAFLPIPFCLPPFAAG